MPAVDPEHRFLPLRRWHLTQKGKELIIMRLTASQILSFHKNGCLLLKNVLDAGDLCPLIEEYSTISDERAQRLYNEGKVSSLYADEPFVRRVACLAAEVPEIAGDLDIMEVRGKATFNLMKNPKMLDLTESLVGPEMVCNPIQHIRVVLLLRLTGGRPIPWQQDAGSAWPEADPLLYANHLGPHRRCNVGERLLGGGAQQPQIGSLSAHLPP